VMDGRQDAKALDDLDPTRATPELPPVGSLTYRSASSALAIALLKYSCESPATKSVLLVSSQPFSVSGSSGFTLTSMSVLRLLPGHAALPEARNRSVRLPLRAR